MSDSRSSSLRRVPTGIPGLDTILQGGFYEGGVYIIRGAPGTGKTILANQACYNHTAAGGQALYVTLLAETHARMLAHLEPLSFYNSATLAERLYYLSGYSILMQEGLDGFLTFLQRTMREQQPSLLVLDGIATIQIISGSALAIKRFLNTLQAYTESQRCTTLLLTHLSVEIQPQPEDTMVDGLIDLRDQTVGLRAVRELEVRKFRGSSYLRGRHRFEITDDGIMVYPRTEALLQTPTPSSMGGEPERRPQPVGIPVLDGMLSGGLPAASSTMLLGPTGSGKTLLGLHFLAAGARERQPGLYFGFYETPDRLVRKADRIGLSFAQHQQQGLLQLLWQAPLEHNLDLYAERLLGVVHQRQIRRLFIDGFEGFKQVALHPARLPGFITALNNELRALGVTTLMTVEQSELVSPTIKEPVPGLLPSFDNILILRYVELRSRLYRLISILKMREELYDSGIHEFHISEQGIDVAQTRESAEAILSSVGQLPGRSVLQPGPSQQPASPGQGD